VRARRWRPLALIAVLMLAGSAGALAAAGAGVPPAISSSPQEVILNPGTDVVVSVIPLSPTGYRRHKMSAGEISLSPRAWQLSRRAGGDSQRRGDRSPLQALCEAFAAGVTAAAANARCFRASSESALYEEEWHATLTSLMDRDGRGA
jgi:hypothetical protein